MESQRVSQQYKIAEAAAANTEVQIEGEDRLANLKKGLEDVDHELLTINREIYASVKLIGDLVYNGFIGIQIARDIVKEITARDKNIGQRRKRHHAS